VLTLDDQDEVSPFVVEGVLDGVEAEGVGCLVDLFFAYSPGHGSILV
jgi:hypothetical protein